MTEGRPCSGGKKVQLWSDRRVSYNLRFSSKPAFSSVLEFAALGDSDSEAFSLRRLPGGSAGLSFHPGFHPSNGKGAVAGDPGLTNRVGSTIDVIRFDGSKSVD